MSERFPPLRKALLAYDAEARLVNSIERIAAGVYRVGYLDKDRKQCYFLYQLC